eukprot:TRINITY_DN17937_c0_g1_i1.p2 TRINITY_DN17937_c0_g1~~TRINITY_DN17937_c0_g1_i1.p2  ORF type:complete len:132 (-),score=22.47 TRINITY_DN17937_c0_g1_i1:194-589(-)
MPCYARKAILLCEAFVIPCSNFGASVCLRTMGRTMTGAGHQADLRKMKKSDVRLDRHSGTGRLGAVKKGGAGGKHTWGVAGEEFLDGDISALDRCDPNYDDDGCFPGTVDKVERLPEPVTEAAVEVEHAAA